MGGQRKTRNAYAKVPSTRCVNSILGEYAMLRVKGVRIYKDGETIGFFRHLYHADANREEVLALYSPECVAVLKKFKLPKTFNYIWVSDISLYPQHRRQGIAGKILSKVGKANTLIACAPGSGAGNGMRMNHMARLAFYEACGFALVIGSNDYAFRYHRG